MDLSSEKYYPYARKYPKGLGKGINIIVIGLLLLGWLILWSSAFYEFTIFGDITWIYIKAFIGSFCLLLGIACISSVRTN